MELESMQRHVILSLLVATAISISSTTAQQPGPVERPNLKQSQSAEAKSQSPIEAKDIFAGLALIVSLISLTISILQRRRERIETVIEGLRGDRRAVTYAAHTIRLSRLLRRNDYRHSLIASLLLAWNFETSDRARAAVLAALVDARRDYPHDYAGAVTDLAGRFTAYQRAAPNAKMDRGLIRLDDVKAAVEAASGVSA
jgi:hypothetical protein